MRGPGVVVELAIVRPVTKPGPLNGQMLRSQAVLLERHVAEPVQPLHCQPNVGDPQPRIALEGKLKQSRPTECSSAAATSR